VQSRQTASRAVLALTRDRAQVETKREGIFVMPKARAALMAMHCVCSFVHPLQLR
jgi:predicted RecA/RadA family phage recombinase